MSTSLQQASANFDIWLSASGAVRRTPIGFAYYNYAPQDDNYTTIADNTAWTLPYSIQYTPKFASSILQVEWVTQLRTINSSGGSLQIYKDGVIIPTSGGAYENADMFYKGDAVNHHLNYRGRQWVTAGTTNTITFTATVRNYSWGGTLEFSNGWGQHMVMVTEYSN